MAGPNSGIAAGAQFTFLGFYDDNGFLTGGTPTAPSNGDTDGNPFVRLTGIKEASPTVGEPETEVITGDDTRLGEFDFDSIASRRFTADMAVFDLQQEATLLGTTVDTVGEMKLGVMDIVDRAELTACLILQGRTKKHDVATRGLKAWSGIIIPAATIIPLGRQAFSERAGAVYRLSITPQVASHRPWGITLSEALGGTLGATYMPFTSDYPIHINVWSGSGVVVNFKTKHRPISVIKTPVFVDRVQVGVDSVTPGTRTVALSSAPASGRRVISVYEFDNFNE